MIITYQDAKKYLESFIQYITDHRIEQGITETTQKTARFKEFLHRLGNPQESFITVTISGTSGKGSISYLISAALAQGGYSVGLAQSPHLEEVTERIRLGKSGSSQVDQISQNSFIQLIRQAEPAIEAMKKSQYGPPSYYEILLGLALLNFAQNKASVAVVEVGIEGKYDATNVLDPVIFVLSNISLDHTNILGNTIQKIGDEATYKVLSLRKHNGVQPVVISGVTQSSIKTLLNRRCHKSNADLLSLHQQFSFTITENNEHGSSFIYQGPHDQKNLQNSRSCRVGLLGEYQAFNASLAITCIDQLRQRGITVSDSAIDRAFRPASFAGRFEMFDRRIAKRSSAGKIILDGAHNPAKMKAFIRSLAKLRPHTRKVFIIGFKHDKNVRNMLKLVVRHADQLFVTKYSSTSDWGKNTGMDIVSIRHELECVVRDKRTIVYDESTDSILSEIDRIDPAFDVIVTGSLYLVGEVRKKLRSMGSIK